MITKALVLLGVPKPSGSWELGFGFDFDEPGLGVGAFRGRAAAGRHRGGAGHQDAVAHGEGAREPEHRLVRGVPADALTLHAWDCLTRAGPERLSRG